MERARGKARGTEVATAEEEAAKLAAVAATWATAIVQMMPSHRLTASPAVPLQQAPQ